MKRITRGAVFAKKLSTLLSKAVRCWPIARQAGCAPPERTAPRLVRSASRRAERPHLRHRRALHHPQWTLQAQLLTTRSYLGCVTGPDGLIYTIGGVLGDPDEVVLGAVEAYSVSGASTCQSRTSSFWIRTPIPFRSAQLPSIQARNHR